MFAGAAREAVFSQLEVVRRVQADFVPVALNVGLLGNPSDDEEGRLYRDINRSNPAQGMCVVNSSGKVLAWVVGFDDDKSVLAFFDYAHDRFAEYPDAERPVAAERYLKFPSARVEDVADIADSGKAPPVIDGHPDGENCPAKPLFPRGTVRARVFGRALDEQGQPVADTVRQEHYVEDRFHVSLAMQDSLAKSLADAGGKRFRIPHNLARLLVSHAYLGQLDVNPLGSPGGQGSLKRSEFWGQELGEGTGASVQIRVEGQSEAAGRNFDRDVGDGRLWQHEVELDWEGLIEVQEGRITRLLLLARGSERLQWGNRDERFSAQADVERLLLGHPIDLACKVRFGLIGEPIAADEAAAEGSPHTGADLDARFPGLGPAQLTQALGPTFVVFHDRVQRDLKLSPDQESALGERLQATIQNVMQFFQSLDGLEPEARERELGSYRGKSQAELAVFLQGTLNDAQLARLRQLELQQQGPFALLARPDLGRELKITPQQRERLMAVVQEMQAEIDALVHEVQSGGNPQDIGPNVMKVRERHEGKLHALLTDAQKRQWKEILGEELDLDD